MKFLFSAIVGITFVLVIQITSVKAQTFGKAELIMASKMLEARRSRKAVSEKAGRKPGGNRGSRKLRQKIIEWKK